MTDNTVLESSEMFWWLGRDCMTDLFPISKLLAVKVHTFVTVGLRQKVHARKML